MFTLLFLAAAAAEWPTGDAPAAWTRQDSGLELQDLVVGTGAEAEDRAIAEVHYTGMLADGIVFDTTLERGETFEFRIGDRAVIRGWEDGVLGMRVGGRRRLVIPPELGYGDRAVGPIPAASVLYFEIELVGVTAPRRAPAEPGTVARDAWTRTATGTGWADLTVGTGARARPGHRVCLDWALWEDGALVEHTWDRSRCTWLRLDDGDLPEALEEGLLRMRAGGVRVVTTADGHKVWRVELTSAAK